MIPLGIPNRNQQKTLLVFLLFILAFPSSTNRVLAIWFGLVWCGLIKTEGQDSHYFIFLRATMASSELNGRVWLFRNKKLFVGNLSLFVNKMLACVGSIFQALYMVCVLVFIYRAPFGACPGTPNLPDVKPSSARHPRPPTSKPHARDRQRSSHCECIELCSSQCEFVELCTVQCQCIALRSCTRKLILICACHC